MGEVCPQCGEEYERLGQHWVMSNECGYPSFTDHQREIITGLLMGDGTLNMGSKNPYIKVEMISPNYLEYLDNEFGVLGTGVSLRYTAEESAKRNRDNGSNPYAKAENYSDVYTWRSRTNPELHKFTEWYSTGKKLWPEDIELTPTVLKHWYVGDGNYHNSNSSNNIRIAMANEYGNERKIENMFANVGLPLPSNWNKYEKDNGGWSVDAEFTVEQSYELWDYMGDPLPDFEYKWPEEYR